MPNTRTVSVCLPTFNGEQYLARAIESVLEQTLTNLELIVVDDASTDKTAEIVAKYAAKDKRVKYSKNSKHLGLFRNYNACLEEATSEYIKPFADDDLLEPTCLDKLSNALESHPGATLASGARLVIDKADHEVGIERSFESTGIVPGEEILQDFFTTFFNRVGSPSQVMFRRKNAKLGFDPVYQLNGDVDYWLRLLQEGDLFYLEDVVCRIRRHPNSATVRATKDLSFMSDSFLLADKFTEYLEKQGKLPPAMHKKIISGLVRKLRNAKSDRDLAVEPVLQKNGNGKDVDKSLDYESVAQQMLLYAADLKTELEELNRTTLQQSAEYEKQIEDWERRARELSLELESIKNSKAWKLTEPLRKLRTVVNR